MGTATAPPPADATEREAVTQAGYVIGHPSHHNGHREYSVFVGVGREGLKGGLKSKDALNTLSPRAILETIL